MGSVLRRSDGNGERVVLRETAHVLGAGLPDNGAVHLGCTGGNRHFLGEDGLLEEDEIFLVSDRFYFFFQWSGRDGLGSVFHLHRVSDAGMDAVDMLPFLDLAGEGEFVRLPGNLLGGDFPTDAGEVAEAPGKNGNAREERCREKNQSFTSHKPRIGFPG